MHPDLPNALRHFKRVDPIMYQAAYSHRKLILRRPQVRGSDRLFAALAESVVSQQLAVKAADAIWARVESVCGGKVTPSSVLKTSLPRLRKAGLSSAKAKTLKELAKAVTKGLDLPSLRKKSPEEAEETLTAVWGIGPWTSEMFLMFALQHPDIFSAGDLGLVRSIEDLYMIKNPSRAKLEKISACWSPYRSLACRILWKSRDTK